MIIGVYIGVHMFDYKFLCLFKPRFSYVLIRIHDRMGGKCELLTRNFGMRQPEGGRRMSRVGVGGIKIRKTVYIPFTLPLCKTYKNIKNPITILFYSLTFLFKRLYIPCKKALRSNFNSR